MASRNQILKGITIPVGADTSGFLAAYKDVDDTCKAIGREVKSLEAALKLEYDNTKFLQAQEANQRYLDETKKKAEYLRTAIDDVMKGNKDIFRLIFIYITSIFYLFYIITLI